MCPQDVGVAEDAVLPNLARPPVLSRASLPDAAPPLLQYLTGTVQALLQSKKPFQWQSCSRSYELQESHLVSS